MTLYSDDKTINNKEVSFLAIFEVLLSLIIYWTIAIYFDTYLHLLISILLAPLLLLKSKKSKEFALKHFFNWLNKGYKENPTPKEAFESLNRNKLVIILVLTIALSYIFIKSINFYEENIILFIFLVFLLTVLILSISISISSIFGQKAGILYGLLSGGFVSFCSLLFLSFFYQGILWGIICFLSVLFLHFILGKVQRQFLLFYSGMGLNFSLVLYVFILKFVSISRYIIDGVKNLPQNWFEESFVVDFRKLPELLADIEKINDPSNEYLQMSNSLKKMKSVNWFEKFLYILFDIFLFLPSIFLRISLKSTFWFYYPLILLVKTKDIENNINKTIAFLEEFSSTKIATVRFLFSILIILIITILHFDINGFINSKTENFKALFSLKYIEYVELSYLEYIQLLISISTIVLYFWSDKLIIMIKNNENEFFCRRQINIFQYINSIRNFFSFIYYFFFLLFLVVYFEIWSLWYVPNILSGIKSVF